jgi:transcriptional antiterminator RfaH
MPYWAVARTLIKRETFAAQHLEAGGFEPFAPRTIHGALFPGYLFIHIGETWRAIERTIGVIGLVKFGEHPARCPDAEIDALKAQVGESGFVHLPARPTNGHQIPIGSKVRLAGGFTAIYVGMTARERQKVLMDILGHQVPVTLRKDQTLEVVDLANAPQAR